MFFEDLFLFKNDVLVKDKILENGYQYSDTSLGCWQMSFFIFFLSTSHWRVMEYLWSKKYINIYDRTDFWVLEELDGLKTAPNNFFTVNPNFFLSVKFSECHKRKKISLEEYNFQLNKKLILSELQ